MSYPTELINSCRQSILNLRENQKQEFKNGADVTALLHQASQTIDDVLITLWQHFVSDTENKNMASLIATGGYGRA